MAKGGDFEREMCKQFSLWFTDGERDDIFYRTAGSGSRATVRRKQNKTTEGQAGDMTYTDPLGKLLIDEWNVEFKTGYSSRTKTKKGERITNWGPLDILDSRQKTPMLIQLWENGLADAEATNRTPILVFRRPLKSPCICITRNHFNCLHSYFGNRQTPFYIQINGTDKSLVIINLEKFFEWAVSPQFYFNSIKEVRGKWAYE